MELEDQCQHQQLPVQCSDNVSRGSSSRSSSTASFKTIEENAPKKDSVKKRNSLNRFKIKFCYCHWCIDGEVTTSSTTTTITRTTRAATSDHSSATANDVLNSNNEEQEPHPLHSKFFAAHHLHLDDEQGNAQGKLRNMSLQIPETVKVSMVGASFEQPDPEGPVKPMKRKSFEVKNLWFYLRNQPAQQQPTEQVAGGQTHRHSTIAATTAAISTSRSASLSFSSKVFARSRTSNKNKHHQRNSSIPENVLLGLRPNTTIGMAAGNRIETLPGNPRRSVPTIIQKDKAQKTWERMMQLKNSEKRNKRKNSRLQAAIKETTIPTNNSDLNVLNETSTKTTTTNTNTTKLNVVTIIIDHTSSPTSANMDDNGFQQIDDDDDDHHHHDNNGDVYCGRGHAMPHSIQQRNLSGKVEVDVVDCGIDGNQSVTTLETKVSDALHDDADHHVDEAANVVATILGPSFNQENFQQPHHHHHQQPEQQPQQEHCDDHHFQQRKPRRMSTVEVNIDSIQGKQPKQPLQQQQSKVIMKQKQQQQQQNQSNSFDDYIDDDDDDDVLMYSPPAQSSASTKAIKLSSETAGKLTETTDVMATGNDQIQQQKPGSCSSYGSLNNDDAIMNNSNTSSQEDGGGGGEEDGDKVNVLNMIDPRLVRDCLQQAPVSGQKQTPTPMASTNYQRKYSLAVPGEPRYMHHHHNQQRRESSGGSRSPLNSSCGGLSPSELSTPSCSNSMIDDQSSYSSHSIQDAIIMERRNEDHHKHCALSVDSLFLKTSHHEDEDDFKIAQEEEDDIEDAIYEPEQDGRASEDPSKKDSGNNTTNSGGGNHHPRRTHSRLVDELCKSFIHLKTSTNKNKNNSKNNSKTSGGKKSNSITNTSSFNDFGDHRKSPKKNDAESKSSQKPAGRRRKNSVTAIIASLLLPESICEKIGCGTANPHLWDEDGHEPEGKDHPHDSNCDSNEKRSNNNNQKWDTSYFNDNKSAICDQLSSPTTIASSKSGIECSKPSLETASPSSPPPPVAPPTSNQTKRKGSIAQITSASATRIVRMLRRTHSAGNSKDAPPSYALFLGAGSGGSSHGSSVASSAGGGGQHHKSKSKSRKRRLKEKSAKTKPSRTGTKHRIPSIGGDSSCGEDCHHLNQHHNNDHHHNHHHNHLLHLTSTPQTGNSLEEMKQRLRFLNRRHTDSSLHSSTVRPSKDEVEKWSKSFRDLMANRYGSALFRAFLCREYSDENIEFWLACEEYRKIRSSKLRNKAKKIYDNYVAVRSPREVNLDHQLRTDIQRNLTTASKFTFDQAQKKIQSLLESDSYVRFLKSELYTDLVMSEFKRNNNNHSGQHPTTDDCGSVGSPDSAAQSRRQSKDSQHPAPPSQSTTPNPISPSPSSTPSSSIIP